MTVAKYGRIVYDTLRNHDINMQITGYTLLLIVKQGICKPFDYSQDLLAYIGSYDDNVAVIGLDILCRFKSKHDDIKQLHYHLLIQFLEGSAWFNDAGYALKALHLFHSHLIIRTNILLNKECAKRELYPMVQYLQFLYRFLLIQIGTKCHIRNEFGFRVYIQICELFMSESSKLAVDYNLSKADQYTTRNCKVYIILQEINEWKFTNAGALNTLMHLCYSNSSVPAGLCNLMKYFDLSNDDTSCLQKKVLELQEAMPPSNSFGIIVFYIISMHNKTNEEEIVLCITNLLHRRFEKLQQKDFCENILKYPIHPLLKVLVLVLENNISHVVVDYGNLFTLCSDIINFIMSQKESIMLVDSTSIQKTVEAILIVRITLFFS